jgi:hypothetical protein
MRKTTTADAQLLLALYETRREPELRRARKWFLTEFDATSWDEIKPRYLSHTDEDRWFRQTISYWEMVASLVNRGLIDPGLFFDHTGEDVVTWRKVTPWIEGARRDIRPTYLYQFEKMVADHEAYRARINAAFVASRERAAKPRAGRSRTGARARKGR